MTRKEINIFSTSFLDLLSGALAAVIILFIIVPKMTPVEVETLEKVKEIKSLTSNLDEAISRIKDSVPKDVYEQISEELENLRKKIEVLNKNLNELEEEINAIVEENDALKQKLIEASSESESLREKFQELEEKLREAEHNNSTANTVEKTLGVFAQFGILCRWNEPETDVDLGVQSFNLPPSQVWRMYPSKPWGILGEDVRERTSVEDERFELFYVPEIKAGEYTAWVNIYQGSVGSNANVSCVMIFHPNKPDEIRYEIPTFHLTKNDNRCFVTFRLTNSGFTILPHREPTWGQGVVTK